MNSPEHMLTLFTSDQEQDHKGTDDNIACMFYINRQGGGLNEDLAKVLRFTTILMML